MGARFLQISVVYLFFGAVIGMTMGAMENFTLVPVHAHLLLLGWVSLAMAGVIYHLYPAAARTKLATLHFWIHNIGLPVFMSSLALVLLGNRAVLPGVIVGGLAVVIGLGLFTLNVLGNVRAVSAE